MSPAYYDYRCDQCGMVSSRYRNARRSRCCKATVTRIEPPSEVEQLRSLLLAVSKYAGCRSDNCPGFYFHGTVGLRVCTCGWQALKAQIEAALNHQVPQP